LRQNLVVGAVDREQAWREAAAADVRIGSHYDDWLKLARGLAAMHEHLLATTQVNSDANPIYRHAYRQWVIEHSWAEKWCVTKRSKLRAACYWLVAHEEEVAQWRACLSEDDRNRWNYPETVKRRYEEWREAQEQAEARATRGVDDGDGNIIDILPNDYVGPSAFEIAQETIYRQGEQIQQANEEIARMREEGYAPFTIGSRNPHRPETPPDELARRFRERSLTQARFKAIIDAMVLDYEANFGPYERPARHAHLAIVPPSKSKE
jgi:hypothetical protein